jgi:hypothetical protein
MYGGGSRRIEGRGNIKRPGDNEYINTIYFPPEKSIQAVRYYTRRRQELKTNPSSEFIPTGINMNTSGVELKDQIKAMIKSGRAIDPLVSNHIK